MRSAENAFFFVHLYYNYNFYYNQYIFLCFTDYLVCFSKLMTLEIVKLNAKQILFMISKKFFTLNATKKATLFKRAALPIKTINLLIIFRNSTEYRLRISTYRASFRGISTCILETTNSTNPSVAFFSREHFSFFYIGQ